MRNYFEIDGYWKDDKSEFSGYIVTDYDDHEENNEEDIFFYGLSEKDIQEAIQEKEDNMLDFVIISYTKLN
jgi:hypothetical protein